MLISQVIELARGGELSKLSDTKFTDSVVLGYINLGLIELYKRFKLKYSEILITMETGRTLYTLDGTDAAVDMGDAEVLSIVAAYDETGAELNINVENDELGIMTPTYNQIQIPNPADGEKIGIVVVAGPAYITDTTARLPVSVSLLEALLHYIGYRAHGSIDGNVQAENNTHYNRFEASIARVKQLGLITEDDSADRSVYNKGFL